MEITSLRPEQVPQSSILVTHKGPGGPTSAKLVLRDNKEPMGPLWYHFAPQKAARIVDDERVDKVECGRNNNLEELGKLN